MTEAVHLTPDDYHVIRPEDFGASGLTARESVGPFVPIEALGPLVTVHDSTFEADRGIGHHPHRGMERLFYILEGKVDHDDVLNDITGEMHTGDLGILTEGQRGMVHSEWNNTDGRTRAYILVYPTDPTPPTASFDAVRDEACPRVEVGAGVRAKQVVTRETDRLNGDLRELGDSTLKAEARFQVRLGEREAGLLFVVDGAVDVAGAGGDPLAKDVERDHTVLLPPEAGDRVVEITAGPRSRVIHVITGEGFGLRRRG